jgi:hypothetical protein
LVNCTAPLMRRRFGEMTSICMSTVSGPRSGMSYSYILDANAKTLGMLTGRERWARRGVSVKRMYMHIILR